MVRYSGTLLVLQQSTNKLFDTHGCSVEGNKVAGAGLATLLKQSADDPLLQAMLFRSFLLHGCAGSFNTLFAGDGYTWTGLRSILAPLGTEFITSGFNNTVLQGSSEVAHIPFCLSGDNGGRPNGKGMCNLPTAL